MRDSAVAENAGAVHRHDLARLVRFGLVIAVVAALVLIGFDNRSDVRLGYVVGEAQAPVWIVLLVAALAGLIIAVLARSNRRQ